MFFKFLNNVPYTHMGRTIQVPDITKHLYIPNEFKTNPQYFIPHILAEGDTLASLSQTMYDTPDYWWVLPLMNDMINVNEAWPLFPNEFQKWFDYTYGLENSQDIHHYIDPAGNSQDPMGYVLLGEVADIQTAIALYNLKPITLYQYHIELNEEKKNVNILLPDFIDRLVSQVEGLLTNG